MLGAASVGAAAMPFLFQGAAQARSVTGWTTPSISGDVIRYGATVDLSCAGTSCKHHLSLERDGGFGWVTVAHSIQNEGNGEYTVLCDQPDRVDSYKSHFDTHTTMVGQTTVGNVGVPTPVDVHDINDSGAARLECPGPK